MCSSAHLARVFKEAVSQLYVEDRQLIEAEAHEQAITGQLARHLGGRLADEGLDVDCEYNRDDRTPDDIKRDQNGNPMRPDIIAHRRRTRENVLAVEVKPYWSRVDHAGDLARLAHLTGQAFKYELGVHLELGRDGPHFTWFGNGTEIGDPDA